MARSLLSVILSLIIPQMTLAGLKEAKQNIKNFIQNKDTTTLDLSKNSLSTAQINKLLKSIAKNPQLAQRIRNLDLSSNSMEMPPKLEAFGQLLRLNLSRNELSQNPDLENNPLLNNLNLSYNNLSEPPNYHHLPNLKDLSIYNNLIKKIGDVSPLQSIKTLQFNNNLIDGRIVIYDLPQLQSLDFSHNNIDQFPTLSDLPNLYYIDLDNNFIRSIDDIPDLQSLHLVYLSNNQLIDMPHFSNPTTIKDIILDSNRLTHIPDISEFTSLKDLSVDYNRKLLTAHSSYEAFLKKRKKWKKFKKTNPHIRFKDTSSEKQKKKSFQSPFSFVSDNHPISSAQSSTSSESMSPLPQKIVKRKSRRFSLKSFKSSASLNSELNQLELGDPPGKKSFTLRKKTKRKVLADEIGQSLKTRKKTSNRKPSFTQKRKLSFLSTKSKKTYLENIQAEIKAIQRKINEQKASNASQREIHKLDKRRQNVNESYETQKMMLQILQQAIKEHAKIDRDLKKRITTLRRKLERLQREFDQAEDEQKLDIKIKMKPVNDEITSLEAPVTKNELIKKDIESVLEDVTNKGDQMAFNQQMDKVSRILDGISPTNKNARDIFLRMVHGIMIKLWILHMRKGNQVPIGQSNEYESGHSNSHICQYNNRVQPELNFAGDVLAHLNQDKKSKKSKRKLSSLNFNDLKQFAVETSTIIINALGNNYQNQNPLEEEEKRYIISLILGLVDKQIKEIGNGPTKEDKKIRPSILASAVLFGNTLFDENGTPRILGDVDESLKTNVSHQIVSSISSYMPATFRNSQYLQRSVHKDLTSSILVPMEQSGDFITSDEQVNRHVENWLLRMLEFQRERRHTDE